MRLPGENVILSASRRLRFDWFANRFVAIDETDHEQVRPCFSFNDVVFGVLGHDGSAGQEAMIKCGGHVAVLAGATIAVGDEIVTDLDGLAAKRGIAAQARYNVVGRSLTAAEPGELLVLEFRPYTVFGANAS